MKSEARPRDPMKFYDSLLFSCPFLGEQSNPQHSSLLNTILPEIIRGLDRKLMEELDWPQTMVLFARKWGVEAEKSLRSMKALQEKGLRKIARILNNRIDGDCFREKSNFFTKNHQV